MFLSVSAYKHYVAGGMVVRKNRAMWRRCVVVTAYYINEVILR